MRKAYTDFDYRLVRRDVLDRLHESRDDLSEALRAKKAELQAFKAKRAIDKAAIADSMARLDALAAETGALERRLRASDSAHDELLSETQALQRQLAAAGSQISALTGRLTQTDAAVEWLLTPGEFVPARERHLICERRDGIGCRLLTLLWTWRLARKIDARVVMFWPPFPPLYGASEGPGEVFDVFRLTSAPLRDEIQIVDGRGNEHFRAKYVQLYRKLRYHPDDLVSVLPVLGDTPVSLPVIGGGWRDPFVLKGESEAQALAEIPELFSRLPIRRDIRNAVIRAAKGAKLYRRVAVHIRRGDVLENVRAACKEYAVNPAENRDLVEGRLITFLSRCPPLDAYVRMLRPLVEQGIDPLLFSDSPEFAHDLAERLGLDGRSIAQSLAPAGFSQVQQALFEALVMSQCRYIVGARSAFNMLANVIGAAQFLNVQFELKSAEFIESVWSALRPIRLRRDVKADILEIMLKIFKDRDLPLD